MPLNITTANRLDNGSATTWLTRVVVAMCACAFGIGVVGLTGWYLHRPALLQINPAFVAMQFNTALALCLSAFAIGLAVTSRRFASTFIAVLIGLLGILTLIEWFGHVDLGIDRLFFRPYPMVAPGSIPGRLSPITACLFIFVATIIPLLCFGERHRVRLAAASLLASVTIATSTVACIGYAAGIGTAYGLGNNTNIAILTAVAFVFLGFASLGAAWDREQRPDVQPDWLTSAVFVTTLLVSAGIAFATIQKQRQEETAALTIASNFVADRLHERETSDRLVLERLGRRWSEDGGTPEKLWRSEVRAYERDMPEIQAIEWIKGNPPKVAWVEPLLGNEAVFNLDLMTGPQRSRALRAAVTGREVISEPFDLVQGGKGFIIYVPVMSNGRPDGVLAGVMNVRRFLDTMPPVLMKRYSFDVVADGRSVFRSVPAQPVDWSGSRVVTCELDNTSWTIRLSPTYATLEPYRTKLPHLLFFFGALLAAVLAGLTETVKKLAAATVAVQRSARVYSLAFKYADIGKAHVSVGGRFLRVNPALCDLTGYDADELRKLDIHSLLHQDDRDAFAVSMSSLLDRKCSNSVLEKRIIHRDGHLVWVLVNNVLVRDDTGAAMFFVTQVQNVTERREASDRLSEYAIALEYQKMELGRVNSMLEVLATTDELTQLHNRRAFMDRLAEQHREANRYNQPLSLILVDIDHFKQFNDIFGHVDGDAALKSVARIIAEEARDCDYVARYGGEEFTILCPQTTAQSAANLAERICGAIEIAHWVRRPITASFGVAESAPYDQGGETLIQRADEALYRAKANGRNCVAVASSAVHALE